MKKTKCFLDGRCYIMIIIICRSWSWLGIPGKAGRISPGQEKLHPACQGAERGSKSSNIKTATINHNNQCLKDDNHHLLSINLCAGFHPAQVSADRSHWCRQSYNWHVSKQHLFLCHYWHVSRSLQNFGHYRNVCRQLPVLQYMVYFNIFEGWYITDICMAAIDM